MSSGATLPGHGRSCIEATTSVAETQENAMNSDMIAGNWKQLTGKVKEQWGKLTDDDLTVIEGKRDQLVGRVQERYGIAKDKAEEQVSSWEKQL
ncbi:hypothetical protein GCM10011320_22280 [Neoroseomonas lacus]|uniref:CsbD-like domain-containing protein n=2 Tax=Neoroseomonas lacus TaxID=287609 RepID=A0A917KI06_9PROT|nr:hypothetical protein GCM10011320_22280 [Neoroseomonas lacus]